MNNQVKSSIAEANIANVKIMDQSIIEYFWRVFYRYKWLILAIIGAVVILGMLLTLLTTPQYTSSTRIEIKRLQNNVANVKDVERDEVGQSLEFYTTQYSLLESRALAERVVRDLNLTRDPAFREAYGFEDKEDGDRAGASAQSSRQKELDQATGILLGGIDISPIRGSSLVDIRFTSPSPQLAAKIANSWVKQYTQRNLERRYASTAEARSFLEKELDDLREKLEKAETDLVTYASDKKIIALSADTDADGRTRNERTLAANDLEVLNKELATATAERIMTQSRMVQAGEISSAALNNNALGLLRADLAKTKSEYAELMVRFEPGYPQAKALASKINELERAISREESRYRRNDNAEFRQAAAREQTLKAKVEGLKSELIKQRGDSIQYNIFQREVDTTRELYNSLLQRYKEIGVVSVEDNNILVVDTAEAPKKPSSPILILNLLLSLIAGGGLALATIFALEQIDQTLKDPKDVERVLGLSLLGTTPQTAGGNPKEDLLDRKSPLAEAYLSIQTSLSFLTDHGTPKSMMFTSTVANEGKSLSAYALASILSRQGHKVALIDADMRNPSVASLLGIADEHGLSNYLSGQDDWQKNIVGSGEENLYILTAGPKPPNPAELLSSKRLKQLVKDMGNSFDHIVIDGPPVLGLADAPLISSAAEGVIYTIEANRMKIRAIDSAITRLRSASATIFGALTTKVDTRNAAYGYGSDYGYGYGYDSDKDA
ncbi:hypothetical protein LPB140_06500 [Sphingorhabdus lutea]|uniref:non-specific protein-tyrosine kinase n=1 Tax=Sphingorhabdus lutea TaxID=1913578 RepID=A0A1L3JBI0_9SPHN|nr:polysaccharide biosynthesis tyrosine autokinase [Sphingorhabdus lutea]APG62495.1 hypothetical protein LPB140_06500 [Sphingorhabdus lutea]